MNVDVETFVAFAYEDWPNARLRGHPMKRV